MGGALSSRVGFGLVAALYVLSFPYHPGLRSPNELCRLWQARALVEDGTLAINGPLQRLGRVGDLSCTARTPQGELKPCVGPQRPASAVEVLFYPSKAPLLSFLAAPVYWATRLVAGEVSELLQVLTSRLALTILPALGLLVLLRRFLRAYVPPDTADTVVVVYAVGTLAFSYAEAFLSHQVTAVLVFACFFVAWRVERKELGEGWYLLAGALGGAAVAAEYTAALSVACVSVVVVASRWRQWVPLARAAGLVVVGAAPVLGFLMWYHAATFGSPLTTGYRFLADEAYQGWHEGGFLGIKLPSLAAFFLSYFSPLRGLFTLSPFLLTALWGASDVRAKERSYFVMLVVLLAANTYFTSSFAYESWGWTPGPLHLTPMIPFLLLPVALLAERLKHHARPAYSILAGLLVSSMVAMGVVVFVNYIPDDISTSVWGLAMPLLGGGVWPVSWLAAIVPNPASGAVLYALLIAVVLWAGRRLVVSGSTPLLLVAVVLVHLGSLRLVPPRPEHDAGAQRLLRGVWVAPPGTRVSF